MRILYVENHAVFAANVVRQFLSQHSVTVVPSLSSARQSLAGGSFDLILVDYDLDDGKGDELVRELNTTGNSMLVIGVSSHDEGNTALMRAGVAFTACPLSDSGMSSLRFKCFLDGCSHIGRPIDPN